MKNKFLNSEIIENDNENMQVFDKAEEAYELENIKCIETIEKMKECTSLVVGDVVQTLGYYEKNDGGAGLYEIVNDSSLISDNGTVHNLANNLKAKLVIKNNEVNVKQLGAKGDGETNDTNSFRIAFKNYNKIFVPTGIYMCMDINQNKTKSNIEFYGTRSSVIKALPNTERGTDFIAFGNLESNPSCSNIYIHDLEIDCDYINNPDGDDKDGIHQLQFFNVDGVTVENVKLKNNKYIAIRGWNCSNVYVNNCNINYSDVGIMFDSRDYPIKNINITNCYIDSGENSEGIWVATKKASQDIYINNIVIKNKPTTAIVVGASSAYEEGIKHKNINISNVYSENCVNTLGFYNTDTGIISNISNGAYDSSSSNINLRTILIKNCKTINVENIISHASLNDIQMDNCDNCNVSFVNSIYNSYGVGSPSRIISATNLNKCYFSNIKGKTKGCLLSGEEVHIQDFRNDGYTQINGTFTGRNIAGAIGDVSSSINTIYQDQALYIDSPSFFNGTNKNPKFNTNMFYQMASDLIFKSLNVRFSFFKITIINTYTMARTITKDSTGNILWKDTETITLQPNESITFTFNKRNNTYYQI